MINKPTMQLGIMQFITNKLYDMSGNRWSVAYSGDKSGYFFRALEGNTDICIIGLDCFIQTKDLHSLIYWAIRHAKGDINTPKIHAKMIKETNACANDLAMFQKYPKQHNEKYLKSKGFWDFFCFEE